MSCRNGVKFEKSLSTQHAEQLIFFFYKSMVENEISVANNSHHSVNNKHFIYGTMLCVLIFI